MNQTGVHKTTQTTQTPFLLTQQRCRFLVLISISSSIGRCLVDHEIVAAPLPHGHHVAAVSPGMIEMPSILVTLRGDRCPISGVDNGKPKSHSPACP